MGRNRKHRVTEELHQAREAQLSPAAARRDVAEIERANQETVRRLQEAHSGLVDSLSD